MKLQQRAVIVTGAGSGIGRAICLEMAKEGARVVVADIQQAGCDETVRLVREAGGEAIAVRVDVTEATQIEAMVDAAIQAYGRIDVVCNNAGIGGAALPALEASEDMWDRVMNVNVKSMFMVCRRVIPHMLRNGGGTIINTSSASGFIASPAGCDYTASKHAILGLTKQLAYEYGQKGIRVNAICPGVIETALTKDVAVDGGPFEQLTMNAPAGRYGQPEEVAKAAVFLASDDASFMHGAAVRVDGGSTVY
ncbi:SDR family NAD(P)-dependent oxidoreductase [Cohnella candidum]|uniref:SDR family oxidoreductase n=1 Tax=Cohnella candidum TaxID=2674991 RepID=A0A3G3K3F8_9BACL|nr:SDR family NAD(P)-dependent oxidoreductase [Cohnella candidum]AYQ74910.1 SDR family oxidoreductase [Cohnella candidum]